jgi:hypothetical protein
MSLSADLCEYSEQELALISALSSHWANTVKKTYISPLELYEILAVECFLSNRQGPEVDALRRGLAALESCKIYRMTKEFDELIRIKQ